MLTIATRISAARDMPALLRTAMAGSFDLVIASQYLADGASTGLTTSWRRSMSSLSALLLEVLGRHDLRVTKLPFVFGPRHAGDSKASRRNGVRFVRQLAQLHTTRFDRMATVLAPSSSRAVSTRRGQQVSDIAQTTEGKVA